MEPAQAEGQAELKDDSDSAEEADENRCRIEEYRRELNALWEQTIRISQKSDESKELPADGQVINNFIDKSIPLAAAPKANAKAKPQDAFVNVIDKTAKADKKIIGLAMKRIQKGK